MSENINHNKTNSIQYQVHDKITKGNYVLGPDALRFISAESSFPPSKSDVFWKPFCEAMCCFLNHYLKLECFKSEVWVAISCNVSATLIICAMFQILRILC